MATESLTAGSLRVRGGLEFAVGLLQVLLGANGWPSWGCSGHFSLKILLEGDMASSCCVSIFFICFCVGFN